MNFRITSALLLTLTAVQTAPSQTLTPRQLFYKDAETKAAAAPAPVPVPKASPPKTQAKRSPPKAAPQSSPAPTSSEVPTAAQEPAPVQSAAYTPERPLGLRYSLVQVVNALDSEVRPNATFRSGDNVRVKVEGNRDGYLYVISRGSSGIWTPLFPAADINGGANKVVAHRSYRLPSDTQAFNFDEQAGQEQLFVIYSTEPVHDIEALIPSLAGPPKSDRQTKQPEMLSASAKPINDAFVSRLRNTYSRDLIVQTVTKAEAPPPSASEPPVMPENAVYIVSKSGGRLVADIQLEHK